MFDDVSLTEEQRSAVAHRGGNLLIVAGAGTGKTTTLTARLADLIDGGVAPEKILLLTFSRRAATQLLHRAEQMTGRPAVAAWGGTFHAVANRLLRRHATALGLQPGFTVLDRSDTADLLALVRDDVSGAAAGRRRAPKQTLADILSRCVNTMGPLSEVLREHFPWCAAERDEIAAAFKAYTARKRSNACLDYDDLLLCWSALLEVPAVARLLQKMFEHILVDEYQDTNPLQAGILEAMAAGGACVTAVGDDAQCIYSFRAATHENIMQFPARFKAEVVTLQRNHRSTPALLSATNAVIAEAPRRFPKQLWSDREGGARPYLVRCDDEADEARRVCRRILEHHEQGTLLRNQAILVRTAHHSDMLELEMTARNIPFVKYGGLKFLEAAHVKDLICLLRLVENPKDELAWFRVLGLIEGIGPATASRLANLLTSQEHPASHLPHIDAPDAIRGDLSELGSALADAASASPESPVTAIERVVRWLAPVLQRRYHNAAARKADLDQLQRAAAAAATLGRFLTDLTLDPPASTSDLAGPPLLDEDFTTISTIHSAKGCEWDVVHVIHASDGNIPSDMATGDAEAIEEERRLLYVAMTRARNHLYTYIPLRYHHRRFGNDDLHGFGQISRFLTPAVVACMDDVGHPRPEAAEPTAQPACEPVGLARVDGLVANLWDG